MSLFDTTPFPDAPIRREHCLAIRWFDADPMPHICALRYGHYPDDHATRAFGGMAGAVGSVYWANEDESEVA